MSNYHQSRCTNHTHSPTFLGNSNLSEVLRTNGSNNLHNSTSSNTPLVNQVLLDDNLMELTMGKPFPLKHRAKVNILHSLWEDIKSKENVLFIRVSLHYLAFKYLYAYY